MPMLYPPKPSRSPEPASQTAEERRAERRRRERLYEIEFFRGDHVDADELLGAPRSALEASDYPARASGAAAFALDPRLARAIEAAANGWVIDRRRG